MNKIIEKFLSQKSLRNKSALLALMVSLVETGIPWSGQSGQ